MQLSSLHSLSHPLHSLSAPLAFRIPAGLHAPALSSSAQVEHGSPAAAPKGAGASAAAGVGLGLGAGGDVLAIMHATHVTVRSSEELLGRPLGSTFVETSFSVAQMNADWCNVGPAPWNPHTQAASAASMPLPVEDLHPGSLVPLAATAALVSPRGLVRGVPGGDDFGSDGSSSGGCTAAVLVCTNRGGASIYAQRGDSWGVQLDMQEMLLRGYVANEWQSETLLPFDASQPLPAELPMAHTLIELSRRRQLVHIESAAWSSIIQPADGPAFVLLALGSRAGVVSVWKLPAPLVDFEAADTHMHTGQAASISSLRSHPQLLCSFAPPVSEGSHAVISRLSFSPVYFDAARGVSALALAVGTSVGRAFVYALRPSVAAASDAQSPPFHLLSSLRVGSQLMAVSALSWSQLISSVGGDAAIGSTSATCSFCFACTCDHRPAVASAADSTASSVSVHHLLAIGCAGQLHASTWHPDDYLSTSTSSAATATASAASASASGQTTAPSHPSLCRSFRHTNAHASAINSFVWCVQANSPLHGPISSSSSSSAALPPSLARQHVQLLSSSADDVVHRWVVRDVQLLPAGAVTAAASASSAASSAAAAGAGAAPLISSCPSLLRLDGSHIADLARFDPLAILARSAAGGGGNTDGTNDASPSSLTDAATGQPLHGSFGLLRSGDGLLLFSLGVLIAGGMGGSGGGGTQLNPAVDRKRTHITLLRVFPCPSIDLPADELQSVANLAIDYTRVRLDEDGHERENKAAGDDGTTAMDEDAKMVEESKQSADKKSDSFATPKRARKRPTRAITSSAGAAAAPVSASAPAAAASAAVSPSTSERDLIAIMQADELAERAREAAAAAEQRRRATEASEPVKMEIDGAATTADAQDGGGGPPPLLTGAALSSALATPTAAARAAAGLPPLTQTPAKKKPLAGKQSGSKRKKKKKNKRARKSAGEGDGDDSSESETDDEEWKGGDNEEDEDDDDDEDEDEEEEEEEEEEGERTDSDDEDIIEDKKKKRKSTTTKGPSMRQSRAAAAEFFKRKARGGLAVPSAVPIPSHEQGPALKAQRQDRQMQLMQKIVALWRDGVEQAVRAHLCASASTATGTAAAAASASSAAPSSLSAPVSLSYFSLHTLLTSLLNPLHLSLSPTLSTVPTKLDMELASTVKRRGGAAATACGVPSNPFTSFSLWWALLPRLVPDEAIAGGFAQTFVNESASAPHALTGARGDSNNPLPPLLPIDAFALPMHRQLPFVHGADMIAATAERIVLNVCGGSPISLLWLEPLASSSTSSSDPLTVANALQLRLALLLLQVSLSARTPFVALQGPERTRAQELQQQLLQALHRQFLVRQMEPLLSVLRLPVADPHRVAAVARLGSSILELLSELVQTDVLMRALLENGCAALVAHQSRALGLLHGFQAVYATFSQHCALEVAWFAKVMPGEPAGAAAAAAVSDSDAALLEQVRALSLAWMPHWREQCPLCHAAVESSSSSLVGVCTGQLYQHMLPRCRRTLSLIDGTLPTLACRTCNGSVLRVAPWSASSFGGEQAVVEDSSCPLCFTNLHALND